MKSIPLVDLSRQYKDIQKEVDKAIEGVLKSTHFILGEECSEFEREYASFCKVKYAVGVGNGLAALELGMRAIGIGAGDEVLTPANSFIASSSSISFTGAKPVLVDCEEETFNIDVAKAEKAITKRTKAIMPVHLYGQLANMEEVLKLAKKYNLLIIEDACQAHGASFKGKKAGSFGDVAAFSFYPGKNLGGYGDGGIVVTNKANIARKITRMRNYGQKEKYNHIYLAWNSRLDTLQAAILRVKLKYLDKWNAKRLEYAKLYNKLLKDLPVIPPKTHADYIHVFHLYVVKVKERNRLAKYLDSKGVKTGLHYPIPIHLQKAYSDLGYKKGDFPITEKLAEQTLTLPLFSEMTEKEIRFVAQQIYDFYHG